MSSAPIRVPDPQWSRDHEEATTHWKPSGVDIAHLLRKCGFPDVEARVRWVTNAYIVACRMPPDVRCLSAWRDYVWILATVRGTARMMDEEHHSSFAFLEYVVKRAIAMGIIGPNELSNAGRPDCPSLIRPANERRNARQIHGSRANRNA